MFYIYVILFLCSNMSTIRSALLIVLLSLTVFHVLRAPPGEGEVCGGSPDPEENHGR